MTSKWIFKKSRSNIVRKKKGGKQLAYILLPTLHKGQQISYSWDGLEVKKSKIKNAGNGVFATKPLAAGTMIPILGITYTQDTEPDSDTHVWEYQTRNEKLKGRFVTGNTEDEREKMYVRRGAANFGLSIAMIANEGSSTQQNCIFKYDFLMTARSIKKGEELRVYYGENYEPIRNKLKYSVPEKHRHKFFHSIDNDNMTFPDSYVRNAVLEYYTDKAAKHMQNSSRGRKKIRIRLK